MRIRAYRDLPAMYAPDVGEVLDARRTYGDEFTKAVVLDARRNREGKLRLKVQWLESSPGAGIERIDHPQVPVRAGETATIIIETGENVPPLIQQTNGGPLPTRESADG